ncbi:ABC transporter ATP-binding protein [Vibrio salinus]|uniref:ABC transporter ATP-binding protein n=1 Tax=Vibrio salinus TaxID=2899784 RepID=UPI001E3E2E57|nr:ABC transporter ATP-binding protein [Vibrio salinus]MCE0493769.1 ABC transporter ATP-binding protein/permease [Vibrio salinus]
MNIYLSFIKLLPARLLRRLYILVPMLGVAGIIEVASIASLIPLMSVALDANKISQVNNFLEMQLNYNQMLVFLAVGIVFIFILKGVFSLYVYRYTYKFVANAKAYIQRNLFYHYLYKDIQFYLNSNSSEYIRNIMTECNVVEARFIMPVLVLMSEIVPLSCLLAFVIYLNPLGILLSSVLFVSVGFIITKLTSPKLKEYAKGQMCSDGAMIKNAQQAFNSIKEVLIYSQQETFTEEFRQHSQQSASCISNGLFINSLPKYILEVVAIIGVFIIGSVAFFSGLKVEEIFIQMGVFFAALVKILPSANKIVAHFQALSYAKPSIENYMHSIQQRVSPKGEGDAIVNSAELGEFMTIDFNDVSFSYHEHSIIDNFNFQFKKGDTVGIVGKTGSGKSTLLNIILGLLSPDEGLVLVNNHKMQEVLSSYRNKIGYVPQETYLLDDSLFHNVTFYRDFKDTDSARERVSSLLHEMDLGELVSTQEGLDTFVGEQGSRLSGGQRQRIGIARALFKDPEIIIFDEATSALDKVTEKKIIDYVMRYKGTKTIIMIAHRESTLEKCDYIVHLENGNVYVS